MINDVRFRMGLAVGVVSTLVMILGGPAAYGWSGATVAKVAAKLPPEPRLVRLDVHGAKPIPGTRSAYEAEYDPSGRVTVLAVVEPPGADTRIVWKGCEVFGGSPDECMVWLDQVTKPGHPLSVSAALGATTQAIALVIRPRPPRGGPNRLTLILP